MKNKFKIIFDILFCKGDYIKNSNYHITKEQTMISLPILGRVVVTEEASKLIGDDALFKKACMEILKSDLLISSIGKRKLDMKSRHDFISNESRVIYEVELIVINKNPSII